ncbi:YcnI family protein [Brevibacillus sp. LEMMJ03]|uniref:YcnI family copper-binding membrane protein n=1 Tax=Brevibacillus sp. LEMMJ03 TaxID=2595056 RepID=UPI00351BB476
MKMNWNKWVSTLAVAGALLTFAGTASAHVTVWPKETKADSYERYTVRVPVEKDSNTVKVRLEFPAGVKVGTVLPVPGWTYEWEKDADGRFKAITWTATAGGIKPHEFMEFGLSAKNPGEPGTLTWNAYQTYADGTVVEWTGAAGSDTPAPTVAVKEGAQAADDHADANKAEGNHEAGHAAAPAAQDSSSSSGSTLPLVLSGLALLVSVISLFRKKA